MRSIYQEWWINLVSKISVIKGGQCQFYHEKFVNNTNKSIICHQKFPLWKIYRYQRNKFDMKYFNTFVCHGKFRDINGAIAQTPTFFRQCRDENCCLTRYVVANVPKCSWIIKRCQGWLRVVLINYFQQRRRMYRAKARLKRALRVRYTFSIAQPRATLSTLSSSEVTATIRKIPHVFPLFPLRARLVKLNHSEWFSKRIHASSRLRDIFYFTRSKNIFNCK